jgi:hypothetical protein
MLTSNVLLNFTVSLRFFKVRRRRIADFIRIVDFIRIDVSNRPHDLRDFIWYE